MKRILCILLSVLLLAGTLPFYALAQSQQKIPIIHLYGFMSCPIYAEDGTKLFPVQRDAILDFVKKLLPSISRLAVNKNWTTFGDRLIPALNEILLPIAGDTQGVPKDGTGPQFVYPTADEIKRADSLRFIYDWRDDPFVSAAQLDDFIRYVTETCGCARVALECHSYAGVVTLTYLATYGTDMVQSVCFNATAVYGATFAGELMRGKMQLSSDALTAYLEGIFDQKEYEALLRGVVSLFDDLGGIRFLVNFLNELFVNLNDRIWADSIIPIFANWPSVWAMVPDDKLDEAYAFARSMSPDEETEDDRIFLEKTQRFNREVRANRAAILREVNDNCGLYVIARYGYPGVPLGEIWQSNSDGVLDTESESFGATCRPYAFSEPVTHPEKLIAPSGAIDASTCLFPTQTWFVRSYKHTQKDPAMEEFTAQLLLSPTQLTIDSIEEYPQFLYYDKVFHDLYIDINQTENAAKWYQDLWRLIRQVFSRWWQKIVRFFTPRRQRSEIDLYPYPIPDDYPVNTILVQ